MSHLKKEHWVVRDVETHAEALSFIREHHYAKGGANTSTYRHGLFRVEDGALMGVAMWIPPTKTAGQSVAGKDSWRGVLSCSRMAVHPDAPTNSASFLLGRSMRLLDRGRWPVLVTYADTGQGHTGAIYKATNWQEDGVRPAGDTWVDKHGVQRGRKRGGRTLLAAEMLEAGFTRNPNSPKIRYVQAVR